MKQVPSVLTIAGSDSSGGAGIQADIKTISAHELFTTSVITSITAQNSKGVQATFDLQPEEVEAQLITEVANNSWAEMVLMSA